MKKGKGKATPPTSGEGFEGVRTEPRKKEIRQPQQVLKGLRVREEFQVGDEDSESMNYSDISDDEDDGAEVTEGAETEEGSDEASGEEEDSGGSSSEEPEWEDLTK